MFTSDELVNPRSLDGTDRIRCAGADLLLAITLGPSKHAFNPSSRGLSVVFWFNNPLLGLAVHAFLILRSVSGFVCEMSCLFVFFKIPRGFWVVIGSLTALLICWSLLLRVATALFIREICLWMLVDVGCLTGALWARLLRSVSPDFFENASPFSWSTVIDALLRTCCDPLRLAVCARVNVWLCLWWSSENDDFFLKKLLSLSAGAI